MKIKKEFKSLKTNKQTIANLEQSFMNKVNAGGIFTRNGDSCLCTYSCYGEVCPPVPQ
jgi:hypothetical protein